MDIKKHFNAYRKLLMADAFRNYSEVAKNLPVDSTKYPTTYDVIIAAKNKIDGAITTNNVELYKSVLPKHQNHFIRLFEAIVAKRLKDEGKTQEVFMNLLAENLNWFKFSTGSITFVRADGLVFYYIPRLTAHTDKSEYWGKVCFDADEIKILNTVKKMSKKRGLKLLDQKTDGDKLLKLMQIRSRSFIFREIHRLNVEDRVSDWTGSLFNEERERF